MNKEFIKYFGFFLVGVVVALTINYLTKSDVGRYVRYDSKDVSMLDTKTGDLYLFSKDDAEWLKVNIIEEFEKSKDKKPKK